MRPAWKTFPEMSDFLILGTFDGVHRGHQMLLKAAATQAAAHGMKSHAVCFLYPPKFFFSGIKENCLLTTPCEKKKLLSGLGCDTVEIIEFSREISEIPAERFFYDFLIRDRKASGIAAGADFFFGKNREGNTTLLETLCARNGMIFLKKDFLLYKGQKISSSFVRNLLITGRPEEASVCLGRKYEISGKIVHGAGIGRTLGFPTANLETEPAKLLPPGVYAASAEIDGRNYPSVASIGRRPTLKTLGNRLITEVHLLAFEGDLYGRTLSVSLCHRIRNEKIFSSKEELVRQIAEDKKAAALLAAAGALK